MMVVDLLVKDSKTTPSASRPPLLMKGGEIIGPSASSQLILMKLEDGIGPSLLFLISNIQTLLSLKSMRWFGYVYILVSINEYE